MSLKKKGTPEQIKPLTVAEVKTLRELVVRARKTGLEPEAIFPPQKDRK